MSLVLGAESEKGDSRSDGPEDIDTRYAAVAMIFSLNAIDK